MANARTTIIIPNYNGAPHLAKLFPSIAAQSRRPARVLVVDNQSTDNSREVAGTGADWLQLERNLGFAAAINRGLSEVKTEFAALVNSDVVLDPVLLAALEDSLADAAAAFACPLLLAADNEEFIDGGWDLLSRSGCPLRALHRESRSHPDASRPRRLQFPPMTAALFRTALFREVGFLDEGFVNYLEDVEFGLRAALAGYDGVFQPEARAVHAGSATLGVWSAKSTYWNARNQVLLLARHYSSSRLRSWWRPILVGNLLFVALAARRGHLLAAMKGKVEILGAWRRWRAIQPADSAAGIREPDRRLAAAIEASELEIEERSRPQRMPSFWRAYFAMGGVVKRKRHDP